MGTPSACSYATITFGHFENSIILENFKHELLAQNKSFSEFMEIARPLLMNMDFGLFPKASDHEVSSEVGWLLYSTRSQDEERLLELISTLVKDTVGVKWRPIRVNDRF